MSKITSIFSQKKGPSVESVVLPHAEDLFRQAYRYLGDKHAAEDLLQDLFLYVCQREETLFALDPVKPWLMQCLYHRFVDQYRKQKRRPEEVSLDNDDEPVQLASCHEGMEAHRMREQVLAYMDQLTAQQRAAMTLFDIEGHSLSQVSKILEMSEGTVKSHLHRGRKKLKQLLHMQPKAENKRLSK